MRFLLEQCLGFQVSNLTQQRYGTSFTVSYPDFPTFEVIPQWFTLKQSAGNHDIVEIAYGSFNPFYLKCLKTGVPIKLSWKTKNASQEFVGYVYNVTQLTQSTLTRNIIVTAVGTGMHLKEGGAKIWVNKTASEIVKDIAKELKLVPKVTDSKIRFSQQSLNGHTRWEKVKELAHRIGYVAQISGVELHFHPIDKMIDVFATSIPVLTHFEPDVNAGLFYDSQTLDMFRPTVGDLSELSGQTKKDKVISGINPVTGKSFTKKSTPSSVGKNVRETAKGAKSLYTQIIPTRVTENAEDAKAMADAFAQLGRFSVEAEGSGQGDPRIAPYRTIEINGTGDVTDGFWIVTEAEHHVQFDGRYTVDFKVKTDGTGKNLKTAFRPTKAGAVPTRNIAMELSNGIKVKASPANLSAKQKMYKQTQTGSKVTPRKWVG